MLTCMKMASKKDDSYSSRLGNVTECVTQRATSMMIEAIDRIPVPEPWKPFYMCEYGAADAGVSHVVFKACIEHLRKKYGSDLPIVIIYEDRPENDFNVIFQNFKEGKSWFSTEENVYVLASGTGFYNQCAPPRTIHLGYSSMAVHWLSQSPCQHVDGSTSPLSHRVSQEMKKKFHEQAKEDWKEFISLRSRELVQGGQLVICGLAVDDDDCGYGSTLKYPNDFHDILHDVIMQMATEKKLSKSDYVTKQVWYHSSKGFETPLKNVNNDSDLCDLQLLSLDNVTYGCPFHAELSRRTAEGMADGVARHVFFKSFGMMVKHFYVEQFAATLDKSIVEEVFQRFNKTLEESYNPSDVGAECPVAFIAIAKG